MGLYDGRDGRSEHGSTAQFAKWLSAPVVLVLDCWSLARSAAALVAGFVAFDREVNVAAVVFNKTGGEAHTAWLRDALDGAAVQPQVLGGIPRDAGVAAAAALAVSARSDGRGAGPVGHVRAWPVGCQFAGGASPEYLHCLAALVETHLNVDALLKLATPLPAGLLKAVTLAPSLAAALGPGLTSPAAASPGAPPRTPGPTSTPRGDDASLSGGGGVRARIAALSAATAGGPPSSSSTTPVGPLSPSGSRPVTPTSAEPPPPPSSVIAASPSMATPPPRSSPSGGPSVLHPSPSFGRIRIGVARDAAFPHVYSANIALLAEAGAELVFFSPAGGDALPPRLAGLYLPSGSPEHFAPQLAANSRLRAGVAAFAAAGGVVLAEGGGMQFLCTSLQLPDGKDWPMCGVLPVDARLAPRGAFRVGYATVTALGHRSSSGQQEAGTLSAPSTAGSTPVVVSSPDGSPDRDGTIMWAPPPLAKDVSLRGQLVQAWELALPSSATDDDSDHGVGVDSVEGRLHEAGWRPAFTMVLAPQQQQQPQPSLALKTFEGWACGAVLASSVQLHLGSNPGVAASFVARCRAVPPGAAAAAAAAAASAPPFDVTAYLQQPLQQLGAPGTPMREPGGGRNGMSTMGLLGLMAGMSPFSPAGAAAAGGGALVSTMRRVPSNSALYAAAAANAREAGGHIPHVGMLRVGSGVSSTFAFGPLMSSEPSTGGGKLMARSRSGAGLDVVVSGDDGQFQWASNSAALAHASSGNMSALVAAGGGSGSGSANNSRATGVHGYTLLDRALRTPSGFPHGGLLVRDLTAPVFAIIDGEVVLPPATRPGMNRLLGDEAGTIVSLHPAATDVLLALGDAVVARLQGISDLCDMPAAAARADKRGQQAAAGAHPAVGKNAGGPPGPRVVSRSRVDVGHLSSAEVEAALRALTERGEPAFVLDTAWLAAAAPSVVITQDLCGIGSPVEGPSPAGSSAATSVVARALAEARLLGPGAPTAVLIVRPRTLADALDAVAAIGAAVGAEFAGLALQESLRARLRAVAAAVSADDDGNEPRRKPRVLSLEGLKPLLTGGHWLPDMKALAGGCDDLQEPGAPAERLRWEQVLSYDPDVLLVLPCNPSLDVTLQEVGLLAQQPGFWALKCVLANQVYLLDHHRFSRPGPRLVEGVEVLARVLHPERWHMELQPGAALRLAMPAGQRCRPHQLRQFFEPYR